MAGRSGKLRTIVLDCHLTEELKWGCPCYTFQDNNIVLIHVFKEYCALLFFKGALLNDPNGILVRQTENVQAARQIRFTDVREIIEMEPVVKAYIYEAIEVEKAGLKVPLKKTTEFKMPEEFQNKLDEEPCLENCFLCIDAGPAERISALFFFSQTIQNPALKDRKIYAANSQWKGTG